MPRIIVDLWTEYIRKGVSDPDKWFALESPDFEDITPSQEDSMELAIVRSDPRDVAELIWSLFAAIDGLQDEIIELEAQQDGAES